MKMKRYFRTARERAAFIRKYGVWVEDYGVVFDENHNPVYWLIYKVGE